MPATVQRDCGNCRVIYQRFMELLDHEGREVEIFLHASPPLIEAQRHVLEAARALVYWLPFYDLGGGATRYSLTSGPAPFKYRVYHTVLLGLLARIPYVPAGWRAEFLAYRHRWGG